jgi:hypothetical protein
MAILLILLIEIAPTSKEVSSDPFGFKRTNLLTIYQLYQVKDPPTRIFPSLCSAILVTVRMIGHEKPDQILKEGSIDPSAFKRTSQPYGCHKYVKKDPPTRIFPSL